MRCLLPVLIISLTVHPCHAWSACGHHIIALLAYDFLTPVEQQDVLQLLEAHPRFTEDFQVPENVDTPEKRPHWLIGRAGYWPDVARRVPEFNRPNWHYQLGSSLTIGENVRVPATPGPLPSDATLETRDLHITQAIELCRRVLQDRSQPAPDRAVAICWLAHLVADAHQPCHAGSLYAEGIFPEGDRGANSIPTRQGRNLHALWDGLMGDRYNAGDVARRSREIRGDRQTWAAAEAAGRTLEPLQWLAESSEFGKSHVYSAEVLDAVDAARRAGAEKVETVDLPEAYLKAAGALAQERAAFAAHRLAAVLREDLSGP